MIEQMRATREYRAPEPLSALRARCVLCATCRADFLVVCLGASAWGERTQACRICAAPSNRSTSRRSPGCKKSGALACTHRGWRRNTRSLCCWCALSMTNTCRSCRLSPRSDRQRCVLVLPQILIARIDARGARKTCYRTTAEPQSRREGVPHARCAS